jgi:hypothetical protein
MLEPIRGWVPEIKKLADGLPGPFDENRPNVRFELVKVREDTRRFHSNFLDHVIQRLKIVRVALD